MASLTFTSPRQRFRSALMLSGDEQFQNLTEIRNSVLKL